MARHLRALLALRADGVPCFEYGNDLRAAALANGVENAFELPGFVPLFVRPSFARGRGPVRWVLLSGDPADQRAADEAARALFPDDLLLQRWLSLTDKWAPIEGLPARTCWLGYGAREAMMLRMNEMVARGELRAPVAVTRDHLDSGASAWPARETENMPDGSDAIGDWPYLNAMLNVAGGADLVRHPPERGQHRRVDLRRHDRHPRRERRDRGACVAGVRERPRHRGGAPRGRRRARSGGVPRKQRHPGGIRRLRPCTAVEISPPGDDNLSFGGSRA